MGLTPLRRHRQTAFNPGSGFPTVEHVITTHSLTKRYGRTVVVDQLSFEVKPGAVTGFLGPNGSGKSTTMRMILGLDTPTSGSALINGKTYADLAWPLREVGALLDAGAFHPARSARNHLRWLALANGIPSSRIDEVLDQVGLSAVAHKRVATFSLGMRQRLGIAGALLGDPGVLVFDEPVNGLDPQGVYWARQLLRGLASEGRTVLVSSHLINEVAVTADHLVVIGRGRLIAEADMSDFVAHANGTRIKLTTPDRIPFAAELIQAGATVSDGADASIVVDGLSAHQIAELAAARQLRIYEMTPVTESLEDVFMALTSNEALPAKSAIGEDK